jgi:hypothetical protein
MFCVMPKDARDPPVERVAAELVSATEAVEHEERAAYLDKRGGDSKRSYFSAIVTTATLSVCAFDPGRISLTDGLIPPTSTFVLADAVRFTKQLSTRSFMSETPMTYGTEAAELAKAKERTVFILRADALGGFLSDFGIDGRTRGR